jgi:hypothetical protein
LLKAIESILEATDMMEKEVVNEARGLVHEDFLF